MSLFKPRPISRVTPFEKLEMDHLTVSVIKRKSEETLRASSLDALYLVILEQPDRVKTMLTDTFGFPANVASRGKPVCYFDYDTFVAGVEKALGQKTVASLRRTANKPFHSSTIGGFNL